MLVGRQPIFDAVVTVKFESCIPVGDCWTQPVNKQRKHECEAMHVQENVQEGNLYDAPHGYAFHTLCQE
jgi:hypothetical protein